MLSVSRQGRRVFGLAGVVLIAAALARAQNPNPPVQYLSASAQSLDRLAKVAKDLDVALPPFLTAAGIQSTFNPIDKNLTLDSQRPVGVSFFMGAGYNVAAGQGIVFELPVTDGSAKVESFVQAGGEKDPIHNDTVLLNGAAFRRTPNYFMFAKSASDVVLPDDANLSRLYAPPAGEQQTGRRVVARINFDLQAFLRGAGVSLEKLIKNQNGADQRTGADRISYELGQDIAIAWLNSIEKVNAAFSQLGDRFELQLALSPSAVASSGKFNRPGMPSGILARLDMAYSPLKTMPWIDQLANGVPKAMAADQAYKATPAQQQALKDCIHASASLLLDCKAESIAVAPGGNAVIVYIVEQFDRPVDLERRIRAVADSFNQAGPPNDSSKMQVQKYQDAGHSILRLIELENSKPTLYLDAVQNGNTVFLAGSNDGAHHVSGVVDLPAAGPIADLAVGSFDLKAIVNFVQNQGALTDVTQENRKLIEDLAAGGSLDFTATREGDAIALNVAMRPELLRKIAHAVQQAIGAAQ